ncbi:hypothetical protein [Planktothricoides raciborskii]|uniref:Uncharacterized protein n=2 Tax=Planktothricoides raciborskii TaxID=132608 RepID=A0AAU8JFW1_9CYAN|nr:hypothetical protein [Planktothricoides raciborskii]
MISTMIASIDDIAKQARQGSVAAIIQVLNEKLAASGVRTRAVLAEGVLQILCEARTEAALEQSTVVNEIREILESLSPRNIHHVNINSRLVREQQLLWLEEIMRDPQNQLLWSEKIILRKPNVFKRLLEDIRTEQTDPRQLLLSLTTSSAVAEQKRQQRQFLNSLMMGAGLAFLVSVGIGWYLYQGQNRQPVATPPQETQPPTSSEATVSPTAAEPTANYTENFAQAVRLAEQASSQGKNAQTAEDWLAIAALWDQASKLMASVPPDHSRYETAKNRAALYRQYSQSTQEKAEALNREWGTGNGE